LRQRLDDAIAEFLAAVEAGHAPDREQFLKRHAALAAHLRTFFTAYDQDKTIGRATDVTLRLIGTGDTSLPGDTLGPGADAYALTLPAGNPGQASEPGSAQTPARLRSRQFGDYELLEEIARGGMGVVFKARQVSLNRVVALKMILSGHLAGPEDVERFRTEAEAAANLDHPGIVPVYEVGCHDGQHFYSMGFVDGRSLAKALVDGPLKPRRAAELVRAIAEAMAYAHQRGVVHRDLKPGNVLLDGSGHPRVTDFGLAKCSQRDSQLTGTGQVLGTPSYMPPEQAASRLAEIGPLSDVYALGAILYTVLVGRPPFQAASAMETLKQVLEQEPVPPRQLNAQIPRDLETICLKCLRKEPAKRYASAQALADDLGRHLRDEPIVARPVGALERGWRWCKRNRGLAIGMTTAAVSLLVAFVLAIAFGVREKWYSAKLEKEQSATLAALGLADENLRRSHRETSQLALTQGLRLCDEENEGHKGLLWLVRALDFAIRAGDADLERVIRHNLGEWSRLVPRLAYSLPHPDQVRGVAVRPDGLVIATACDDGRVRFWDAATGSPLPGQLEVGGAITVIKFSPSGQYLATGCLNGQGRIWNLADGQPIGQVLRHGGEIHDLDFSPDGSLLLTGSHDNAARLWDALTGAPRGTLPHASWVMGVAFHPRGDTFVTVSFHSYFQVWETSTRRLLRTVAHNQSGSQARFSSDGQWLALALTRGVGIWNATTYSRANHVPQPTNSGAVFSPDALSLLVYSRGGKARVWHNSFPPRPVSPTLLHQGELFDGAFLNHGQAVVTANGGNVARVWALARPKTPRLVLAHPACMAVAFSPDGSTLASGDTDYRLVIFWDTTTGRPLRDPLPHPTRVLSLAFSPDGKLLLVGADPTTHLWNVATGKPHAPPMSHAQSVWRVAFTPDGKFFAGGAWSPLIRVGETQSGRATGVEVKHGERAQSIAFSGDGRRLFTGASNGSVQVWDRDTGRPLGKPVFLHREAVSDLRLTPDGKRLLTGSNDGSAHLWDAETFASLSPPFAQQGAVSAAMDPSGRLVITGSEDSTARVWDAATGKPIGPALPHSQHVCRVDFHPREPLVATCSGGFGGEGAAYLWEIAPEVRGDVTRVRLWVELLTGMKLEENGEFVILDHEQLDDRRRRLAALGGRPQGAADEPAELFARPTVVADASSSGAVRAPLVAPDPAPPEVTLEGELLRVVGRTGGSSFAQPMNIFSAASWSGNEHLFWRDAKLKDRLDLELPVARAGRYEVQIVLTKARDYATVQLWLDGEKLGEPIDLYSQPGPDPAEYSDVVTTGVLKFAPRELAAGAHKLSVEVVGANRDAKAGYMFGLDYVRLRLVAP
jgi:WD40 repeat protein